MKWDHDEIGLEEMIWNLVRIIKCDTNKKNKKKLYAMWLAVMICESKHLNVMKWDQISWTFMKCYET